jgi:uncharacterized protein (TIGR00255 family)
MTGFGAADGPVAGVRLTVEVRSVNHRFFNATIKLPHQFARFEGEVRETLRRSVTRGHVTLSARSEAAEAGSVHVDEGRFAAYVELLRTLKARHGLEGDLGIETIMRLPDIFASADAITEEACQPLVALVEAATAQLLKARTDEGARLRAYLSARLEVIDQALARIADRGPVRVVEQRDKLRAAVKELLDGTGSVVDEQRIAMEIALLAERLDVQEELSRFHSHIVAFRGALASPGGEPVGKRLGFLLQEMLREANTTGSKANDALMLNDVVLIKEELERLREQVENLE